VNPSSIQAEAGIASALLRVTEIPGDVVVKATAKGLENGIKTISSVRRK